MKLRTPFIAGLLVMLALVVPAPAHAYQSLTFALVVPCAEPNGASSADVLPIELPKGVYAYTIAGACAYGIENTPPCYVSVHAVIVNGCTNLANPLSQVIVTGCWGWNVWIDDQCVGYRPAGTIDHPGGPMTARYLDGNPPSPYPGNYDDNAGAFIVTLTFTPL